MSNARVTITLGRSGQVVTRDGKRSRADRFENHSDGLLPSISKRQRGDGFKWNPGLSGQNGSQIAQNDLRLKLLRKRMSKQIQNVVSERQKMGSSNTLSGSIQTRISPRMQMHKPDPGGSNSNSLRKTQLSQTSEGLGAELQDKRFKAPNGLSPLTSIDELRRLSSMGQGDFSRGRHFLTSEIRVPSRPTNGLPIVAKTTPQVSNVGTQIAATSAVMQKRNVKIPYLRDEPLTITGFLHSLGLGKYSVAFQAEEVDMTVLKQMGDKDLKELGIPMGPRKKILFALMPCPKRPASIAMPSGLRTAFKG